MAMSILTTILLIYAGCCGYLYVAQRSFIYFPVPAALTGAAEDLRFDIDGETIQVWRLNGVRERALIYFGGNAEDVTQNIPQFSRLFPDRTVYLANYRGYGASTGRPSEEALLGDAGAIYDRVAGLHTTTAVAGRSLGSGVAMFLAATGAPERLVLITPYASLAGVAQAAYPLFPVSLLLRDRYDSISRADRIAAPTLLLIAARDEIIPRWSSDQLAAAIDPALVSVIVIDGASHNTIQNYERYAAALEEFLR